MDTRSGSLRIAAKDFNTEDEGRTIEGHREGRDALRAKRCLLSLWSSVVLPASSVFVPYACRGCH
jgi:hypothetical protein